MSATLADGRDPLLAVEDVNSSCSPSQRWFACRWVGARRLSASRSRGACRLQSGLRNFPLSSVHARGWFIIGHRRVPAVNRQRAEHAFTELHLQPARCERAQPQPPIFLRHEWAPKACERALLTQVGPAIPQRLGRVFSAGNIVVHPLADFFTDRLGLGRDFEIDPTWQVSSLGLLLVGLSMAYICEVAQRQRTNKLTAANHSLVPASRNDVRLAARSAKNLHDLADMFPGLGFRMDQHQIRAHFRRVGGKGPPLLAECFSETTLMWHRVAPQLPTSSP